MIFQFNGPTIDSHVRAYHMQDELIQWAFLLFSESVYVKAAAMAVSDDVKMFCVVTTA